MIKKFFKRSAKKKPNDAESTHSIMLLPEPGTQDKLNEIERKLAQIQGRENALVEGLIFVCFLGGFLCGAIIFSH